jgi:hypothetical protein
VFEVFAGEQSPVIPSRQRRRRPPEATAAQPDDLAVPEEG